VLYCAQVEQATLHKEDAMHPDQLYSTRQLQHVDLMAEAERERSVERAERTMEGRMNRQQNRQTRRWILGWLGGVAGGIGAVALAVTLLAPWGQSGGAATTSRTHNRVFADEAGYTATINEYLAPGIVGLDTVADRSFAYGVVRQPAASTNCQMVLGVAVALCAPSDEATREQHVTRQLYGPR
jgi:hypothetical protein